MKPSLPCGLRREANDPRTTQTECWEHFRVWNLNTTGDATRGVELSKCTFAFPLKPWSNCRGQRPRVG
eukprot:10516051-Alexandrium_andersonii.AAC.1